MLDAVRRVVEQALAPVGKDPKPVSVMERTGPGKLHLLYPVVVFANLSTHAKTRSLHRRRSRLPPSQVPQELDRPSKSRL